MHPARWIHKLRMKARSLFRRRQIERELDDELQFHLERDIEERIAKGLSPDAARRESLLAMGGIEQRKEESRDTRRLTMFDSLIKDLRYAARRVAQKPGFALAATLTIALGAGVNTSLFSIYNAIALRPLPVAQASEVVRLKRWFQDGYRGDQQYRFSYGEYNHLRTHNDVFTDVVAASMVSAESGDSERFQTQVVSANYFELLGVRPTLGRAFVPEDTNSGSAVQPIVLSHAFWRKRFHADRQALGQTFRVSDKILTVVGVAPEGFSESPVVPDFWEALKPEDLPNLDWLNGPAEFKFTMLARLKPSISLGAAQAQVDTLLRQYPRTQPETVKTTTLTLEHPALFGNVDDIEVHVAAVAAMLVVGLVLLVACANLANIMLAHGMARQREIAIRLALGAGRARIVRQLLMESFLLSLAGGITGLLLSIWMTRLLWNRITSTFAVSVFGDLTVRLDFSPDGRVFAYALTLAAIATLLFGLLPAIQATRPDVNTSLKDDGGLFGRQVRRSRLRQLLIAAQVTISTLFLLVGGILMRGLLRAQQTDIGYEVRTVYLIGTDFGQGPEAAARQLRVMERLKTLPEVYGVARGFAPLFGSWTVPILVGGKATETLSSYASDSYFDLLGIPILRGRGFTEQEAREGAGTAVISESTARRLWPGTDPLSKRLKLRLSSRGDVSEFEVIGIAKDVRFANPTRIDPAHVYIPTDSTKPNGLLIRTRSAEADGLDGIRQAIGSVDKRLLRYLELRNLERGPLAIVRFMTAFLTYFLAALGGLSLVLAGVGIYGVTSYAVGQRTREIGIRVALGASPRGILQSMAAQDLSWIAGAILAGASGAMAITWLLHKKLASPGSSDLLQGTLFYDPAVFLGLPLFVLTIAAFAAFLPARQALRVDPIFALRYE